MKDALLRLGVWCRRKSIHPVIATVYLLLAAGFLLNIWQFRLPGKGFTYLITFGSQTEKSRLSKFRQMDYYVEQDSFGYDAQFYAQIAMDPSLQNTQLPGAVDNLPYRARRILLPALAYVLGWGQPSAILQAYALINVVSWLLLAALLLHWFPPRGWSNLVRWGGVLLSAGVCLSLRTSLTDGPSLLLIALGAWLLAKGWPTWSAIVLGVSGLAKETNLLGAAAFFPTTALGSMRTWLIACLRGLLVALPLALWILYIAWRIGPGEMAGHRNFALPLVAYFAKWREVLPELPHARVESPEAVWSLLALIALTVQLIFLVVRPAPRDAWWRIGFTFSLLMVFLGEAVWEGFPGAATRVLLPMQLAFNVLVPHGGRWLPVLLLGNLTAISSMHILMPPLNDGLELVARDVPTWTDAGRGFKWQFSSNWYGPERIGKNYWLWTQGDGTVALINPHDRPVRARLKFGLSASSDRGFTFALNGDTKWQATTGRDQNLSVNLNDLILQPGSNTLSFLTDRDAIVLPPDPRKLAFRVHNLRLEVLDFVK